MTQTNLSIGDVPAMSPPLTIQYETSKGGRMSRMPASRSERSGNPKIVGLSPEYVGSKPGRVKPKTLKLILVAS